MHLFFSRLTKKPILQGCLYMILLHSWAFGSQTFVLLLSFHQRIIHTTSDNTDVLISRHLFFNCPFIQGSFRLSQTTLLFVLSLYSKVVSSVGTCFTLFTYVCHFFPHEQFCSSTTHSFSRGINLWQTIL